MPRNDRDEYSDEIRRKSEPRGGKIVAIDSGRKKTGMSNKRKGTCFHFHKTYLVLGEEKEAPNSSHKRQKHLEESSEEEVQVGKLKSEKQRGRGWDKEEVKV